MAKRKTSPQMFFPTMLTVTLSCRSQHDLQHGCSWHYVLLGRLSRCLSHWHSWWRNSLLHGLPFWKHSIGVYMFIKELEILLTPCVPSSWLKDFDKYNFRPGDWSQTLHHIEPRHSWGDSHNPLNYLPWRSWTGLSISRYKLGTCSHCLSDRCSKGCSL